MSPKLRIRLKFLEDRNSLYSGDAVRTMSVITWPAATYSFVCEASDSPSDADKDKNMKRLKSRGTSRSIYLATSGCLALVLSSITDARALRKLNAYAARASRSSAGWSSVVLGVQTMSSFVMSRIQSVSNNGAGMQRRPR